MNTKSKIPERLVHASATTNLRQHTYYRYDTRRSQGHFNRLKLPNPTKVLHQLGFYIGKPSAKGYLKLRCPFHKEGNERLPSLNLHQSTGHYRCHACGAKGGDILAFYMEVTGKTFIVSVKELGAWETNR